MAKTGRTYNYTMGFKIDGAAIPDPSAFSGARSDLDTLGKRDATGRLHRNMVSAKYHTKLEWKNIDWSMVNRIGGCINGKDRFTFTYPDPFGGTVSITAYAGDREWTLNSAPNDGGWIGDLSVSIIEI